MIRFIQSKEFLTNINVVINPRQQEEENASAPARY